MRETRLFRTVRNTLVDWLPPVVSRQIARHVMPRLGLAEFPQTTPAVVHKARTLAELDEWIARAEQAGLESDDALRRVFASFEFEIDAQLPPDPFSEDYRVAQMALYSQISGRAGYASHAQELTPFEFDSAVRKPFPYATLSPVTVGDQLVLQGTFIRQLKLKPGSRIVEFGPGWGNLTLELAKMGMRVTAVDVYPAFGRLIEARAHQLGLEIEVVVADMLDYRAKEPFDAAIFFESFHHCSDHQRMLVQLRDLVNETGLVAFGSEPIIPMRYPWGIRTDGMAAWSIRRHGWLENGFTESYFLEALQRAGWCPAITYSKDLPSSVVVATRSDAADRTGQPRG